MCLQSTLLHKKNLDACHRNLILVTLVQLVNSIQAKEVILYLHQYKKKETQSEWCPLKIFNMYTFPSSFIFSFPGPISTPKPLDFHFQPLTLLHLPMATPQTTCADHTCRQLKGRLYTEDIPFLYTIP